ncbi:putative N-acetyltransferase [Emticicia aquatica]|uniref:N-acetyltransferase n=1 Tax=Emticicia aquatica TaxID=1681835 RepID=A0ABM9AMD7_9BACT|nr:GNAT family N-acetyltransferase [Emticicia aquatica]CAH0994975.1 putative N-acetyltransferase [Emticicia aquatica]
MSQQGVTYRNATHKDIKVIREIANKTWFVTYEPILGKEQPQYMFDLIYSEEALAEQMNNGQTFVLQLIDNQVVSFASYSEKDDKNKIYKLNKLYLNPDFQGGGFGRKILEEVENQLTKLGVKTLDLNVNRFNKARFFYEKVGFKMLLEEDIPIGPYWMNDYVMRKELV